MARKHNLEAQLADLRGRRWSEADARVVLGAQERSGETICAFARANDLNAQRIYWWRSRLSNEAPEEVALDQLSFAPVMITDLGRRIPAVVLRLGELEIEVVEPHKIEPTWLAQLLVSTAKGGE